MKKKIRQKIRQISLHGKSSKSARTTVLRHPPTSPTSPPADLLNPLEQPEPMPERVKDANGKPTFAIVKSAIFPRIRRREKGGTQHKSDRPPLTEEQKKKMSDARLEKKGKKEAAMDQWLDDIEERAAELAQEFKNDKQDWLTLLYRNGQRMIKMQAEPNAFNTFKSMKSRDGGGKESLMSITENYIDEYRSLTADEKAKYVADFEEARDKETQPLVTRPTAKSQAQDLAHTLANVEAMFKGLQNRIGVDVVLLVVRNRTDGVMDSYWYFSRQEIAEYMPIAIKPKWNLETVGAKVEAFCVAGCDTSKLYRTSGARARALKQEIRALLTANLAEVSGRPNPKVHYEDIDQMLTRKEGIVIENWPYPQFRNLSNISTALPPLFELRDKIRSGHIHFRKMSKEEHEQWIENEDKGPKARKPRCDAGVKRKKGDHDLDEDEDDEMLVDEEEEETEPPKKKKQKEGPSKEKSNEKLKVKSKSKAKPKSKAATDKKSNALAETLAGGAERDVEDNSSLLMNELSQLTLTNELPNPPFAPAPVDPYPMIPPAFLAHCILPLPIPSNPVTFNLAPASSFAHPLNNPMVWNLGLCMAQGRIESYPQLERYLQDYLKDRFVYNDLKPMLDVLFQEVENSVIEEELRRLMTTYLDGFAPAASSMDLSSALLPPPQSPQELILPAVELPSEDLDGLRRSKRAPKPKEMVHLFSEDHPNTRVSKLNAKRT
ncbi:hypothetical protein PQX77_020271 [Marasmius sp. AFHP31]|nr:hypothetical protein PQX77_020271 [Marasmius sp. AFHP31]